MEQVSLDIFTTTTDQKIVYDTLGSLSYTLFEPYLKECGGCIYTIWLHHNAI